MSTKSKLPDVVRQIAIVTVGARYNSAFELYAHMSVMEKMDMTPLEKLSTLVSGSKPEGLGQDESIAYDLAYILAAGRVPSRLTYDLGVKAFGHDGMGEYIQLCAFYCMISALLNGFAQPAPIDNTPA